MSERTHGDDTKPFVQCALDIPRILCRVFASEKSDGQDEFSDLQRGRNPLRRVGLDSARKDGFQGIRELLRAGGGPLVRAEHHTNRNTREGTRVVQSAADVSEAGGPTAEERASVC
jgi:hypothetical protein